MQKVTDRNNDKEMASQKWTSSIESRTRPSDLAAVVNSQNDSCVESVLPIVSSVGFAFAIENSSVNVRCKSVALM